ncbi:class I adenylate-forming enzyme family protein [Bacillus dakarensis]|uniref:class I adenylate-forming enzyme family protein n=1 Tax=Robertmurraya dakarensis TaxID=1926278 RepID=UPI0009FF9695|nr:class I adenylate-forming enzyme family protein [Bacillus dakarensis]
MIDTDIKRVSLFGREGIKVFAERPSSIKDFFKNTVSKHGNKDALYLDDDKITYKEIDEKSDRLIASLQSKYGIKKGDRIATLLGNSFEFAIIVMACVKSGTIMVPVNTKLRTPEVAFVLSNSRPKVLLCDQDLLPVVEDCKKNFQAAEPYTRSIVSIGEKTTDYDSLAGLLAEQNPLIDVEVNELDPAFILYTSGTTGRPKGAVISHINVIHSVMHYQRAFKGDENVRSILAVPFFHVTGLVARFLQSVYIGGSMLIIKKYQNEKYIKQSYDYKINVQSNVPTIYAMMATSPLLEEYSFDFVKRVGFGGSPIYQHTLEMLKRIFPNATLHNVYGATETTSPTTIMPDHYPMSKASSVGLPVETADIMVIDTNDRELGPNQEGELLIKGPMVIGGYWENPEANKTSFVDGYWRSGDIAKIDEDGFVYILDRKKDMINRGGEKIFSIEVEDVLKKHSDILEAAVVGVPDEIYGERVKAFVVSDSLNEQDQEAIRSYCAQHLARFKIPEFYEFIDELPKNASGKVLKHQLRI